MAEVELTEENFQEEVLNSDKPVLVDFWAEWCVPCRMLAPVIEELAEELDGKAVICKANVDETPTIAEKYTIQSIPTIMIFNKGEVVNQTVGASSKEVLLDLLNDLI